MICAPCAAAASTSADTASIFGRTGPGRGSWSAATVIVRVMPALCRKLLARAMEAAAAADDAARVDADRAATGEQRRERIDRRPILGDAIGGADHDAVADIEIHIARRRDLTIALDTAGGGQGAAVAPPERFRPGAAPAERK